MSKIGFLSPWNPGRVTFNKLGHLGPIPFSCVGRYLDMLLKVNLLQGDFTKLFTEIDLNFFHRVDKRKMDAKAGYALMAMFISYYYCKKHINFLIFVQAAHFSARHFGEARGVLTKVEIDKTFFLKRFSLNFQTLQIIDEIGLSTFTNGYIKIDKEIINGYKIALGLMESKKEVLVLLFLNFF